MKKAIKVLLYLLLVIIIGVAGIAGYVAWFLPSVGDAPTLKVELTPQRIERGKYLANHVAVCMDCHSTRDWSKFSGPPMAGTEGSGGDRFDQTMGFPGVFYAKNITPYGLSSWTDGEIFRVITTGVNKQGKALFPVMPYHYYGQLDEEDIKSIIAYIRTLPTIKKDIPASKADFPFSLIMNTIPTKATFSTKPNENDSLAYGRYLVTATACVECHSQVDNGQIIPGTEFGGGRTFDLPGGILRTANITPDATGIGSWSKEQFIQRFKQYQDSSYQSPNLAPTDFNSIMPWTMYSGMTTEDLGKIYDYLRTLKPRQHVVEKFTKRQ
jgi:mono/diheme cytochrome c family protein